MATIAIEIAEGIVIYPNKTEKFDLYIGDRNQAHYILYYYKDSLQGTYGRLRYLEKKAVPEEDAAKYLASDVEKYGIDTVMDWIYDGCYAEQLKM